MVGADPIAPESQAKPEEKKDEEDPRAARKDPKKWRHGGLIVEPRFGALGCSRSFCAGSSGHDARPGMQVGGFIGGNVFGLLDVGIEAQWGTLRPADLSGRNAITLYGLDPALLQQVIASRTGTDLIQIDFTKLLITGDTATMRSVNMGPAFRIHFIRKGRGIAYIGAGMHYQLWRNRYETASGPTRLDFHGLSAPLRVGGGAFVHPNIAITGEFSYTPTFFIATGVSHVDLSGVAPLTVLEGAALEAGSDLRKGLPHFWSFSLNVRFRLGL